MSLLKDTAVYGVSSVLGRFLNWLLTYVYTRVLLEDEFGRMTNLYAWVALLVIILTYGMETAFFRFANKHDRPGLVYSTTLGAIATTTTAFAIIGWLLLPDLTRWLGVVGSEPLVSMLIGIIALDVLCAIPLGYLRYAGRPWRFMGVRMSFIGLTIGLTLATFYIVPHLAEAYPSLLGWYDPRHGLYYIFGINLIGNVVQLLLLLPTIRRAEWAFSWELLGQMLRYGWPLLLLGLVGSFNNQADKIIFPLLFDDPLEGQAQLGIYSACYKLAIVIVLFTQAFRYAYDPYIFARAKEGGEVAKDAYAQALKSYTLFVLCVFVAVLSMLDIVKLFIAPSYHGGLGAVGPVMVGQMMFGIYYNLSTWYKVTDRTHWGAILSLLGALSTVLIIVLGAKTYGFMACAWASVISNGLIMLLSYWLGQRYYPIRYPLAELGGYVALATLALGLEWGFAQLIEVSWVRLGFNAIVAVAFCGLVGWREVPHTAIQRIRQRIGL